MSPTTRCGRWLALLALLLAPLGAWAVPLNTAPSIAVSGPNADCVGTLTVDNRYGYFCWVPPEELAPPPEEYTTNIANHALGQDYVCVVTLEGELACWSIVEANPGILPDELSGAEVSSVCITQAVLHLRPIACAVLTDGGVSCFVIGNSTDGGGPDHMEEDREYPGYETLLDVPASITDATQVVCGVDYACALSASGSLTCWGGANKYNQTVVPADIASDEVLKVSAGSGITCVVTKATALKCWGRLGEFELYDAGAADVSLGKEIVSDDGVSFYGSLICALTINNLVRCFDDRQAVIPMDDIYTSSIRQVAADFMTVCSLQLDGELVCSTFEPTVIIPDEFQTGVEQAVSGYDHACILKDSQVGCLGLNDYGEGDVPEALQGEVAQLAAGWEFTCAITKNTSLVCWGQDFPTQLEPPAEFASNIQQADGGGFHTCAVTYEGALGCWGALHEDVDYNQTAVPPEMQSGVRAVSAGAFHTCALTEGDELSCWGSNDFGQSTVPPEYAENVRMVSAGFGHTCVVLNDNTAGCWGDNELNAVNTPESLQNGVIEVAADGARTCLLSITQNLFCFGDNSENVFGDNAQSLPAEAQDGIATIASGVTITCAINTDDDIHCFKHPIPQEIPPEYQQLGAEVSAESP